SPTSASRSRARSGGSAWRRTSWVPTPGPRWPPSTCGCAATGSGRWWPTTAPVWPPAPGDSGVAGPEGADPGDGLAEDQRVDLVGALVGVDGLQVVHVADHGVLEGDPVGAQHAPGLAGHPEGLPHV